MIRETWSPEGQTVLVTGAAGFIGAAFTRKLLETAPGVQVVGLDEINSYYDPGLKRARLAALGGVKRAEGASFEAAEFSITDRDALRELFRRYRFSAVVHLAAQAGVRYSIDHPDAYIESNLIGTWNILEACRHAEGLAHLVFASSSSVYGANEKVPYSVEDKTDRPVSLYAATKKSGELLAYSYSKLYGIPSTGLRFFTVYGPAGRPDMAYFSFTEKLRRGEPIALFGFGKCRRDFTYIDDITEGILRVLKRPPEPVTSESGAEQPPYRLYNIGGQHPVVLTEFVRILAEELTAAGVLPAGFDLDAHLTYLPMQPGDVAETYADCGKLSEDTGFAPSTDLRTGLRAFARWYADYRRE